MGCRRVVQVAVLLAVSIAAGSASAYDIYDLFPFRFVPISLPSAVEGRDYRARVMTFTPLGPVSFSSTGLPAGLVLDPATGEITGRPAVAGDYAVEFRATDTKTEISRPDSALEVLPAPAGAAPGRVDLDAFPEARQGVLFEATVPVAGGVGPFAFGASGLPPGLRIDGSTGAIRGVPESPGAYRVTLAVLDRGAEASSERDFWMDVLPPGSSFRFVSRSVHPFGGLQGYDRLETAGATGAVTYPSLGSYGFGIHPETGQVYDGRDLPGSGATTLEYSATDGTDVIRTRLGIHSIVSHYGFHWQTERLPIAFAGLPYGAGNPVRLAAVNAPLPVTYYTTFGGLPPGLSLDPATGLLSGTPTRAGLYHCSFDASCDATGEFPPEDTFLYVDVLVLPPGGGDATGIATNYWTGRQRVRARSQGRSDWTGSAVWNADRREGRLLESIEWTLILRLGVLRLHAPREDRRRTSLGWSVREPRGDGDPYGRVDLDVRTRTQSIRWRLDGAEDGPVLPASIGHVAYLGEDFDLGRTLDFDAAGRLVGPAAGSRPAFVVSRGRVSAGASGGGSLRLEGILEDADLASEPGASAGRLRLFDGVREVIARDITDSGRLVLRRDSGGTGRFELRLGRLAIGGLPRKEAHLGVELTIGERVYFTGVTFFERSPGEYGTTAPPR